MGAVGKEGVYPRPSLHWTAHAANSLMTDWSFISGRRMQASPSPKWRRRKAGAAGRHRRRGARGLRRERALPARGWTRSRAAPASPRARSISISRPRRTCSAPSSAGRRPQYRGAASDAFVAADLPFARPVRAFLPRFAEMVTAIADRRRRQDGDRRIAQLPRARQGLARRGRRSRRSASLAGLIERAQARGEVRAGDPRIHAFSIMGPMLMGVLWRETFTPVGGAAIDLPAIARQHAETVLDGLLVAEART